MSAVQEINTAIRNHSRAEREELIAEMPALLPELDGDAAWERPKDRSSQWSLGRVVFANL